MGPGPPRRDPIFCTLLPRTRMHSSTGSSAAERRFQMATEGARGFAAIVRTVTAPPCPPRDQWGAGGAGPPPFGVPDGPPGRPVVAAGPRSSGHFRAWLCGTWPRPAHIRYRLYQATPGARYPTVSDPWDLTLIGCASGGVSDRLRCQSHIPFPMSPILCPPWWPPFSDVNDSPRTLVPEGTGMSQAGAWGSADGRDSKRRVEV